MVPSADCPGAWREPRSGLSASAVDWRACMSGDRRGGGNGAKAPTGSDDQADASNEATSPEAPSGIRSLCEPFRSVILAKLEAGLSAQRIFQDLVSDHVKCPHFLSGDYESTVWVTDGMSVC
jgi:hypothetical protein